MKKYILILAIFCAITMVAQDRDYAASVYQGLKGTTLYEFDMTPNIGFNVMASIITQDGISPQGELIGFGYRFKDHNTRRKTTLPQITTSIVIGSDNKMRKEGRFILENKKLLYVETRGWNAFYGFDMDMDYKVYQRFYVSAKAQLLRYDQPRIDQTYYFGIKYGF